jgi:hypothetical protein
LVAECEQGLGVGPLAAVTPPIQPRELPIVLSIDVAVTVVTVAGVTNAVIVAAVGVVVARVTVRRVAGLIVAVGVRGGVGVEEGAAEPFGAFGG